MKGIVLKDEPGQQVSAGTHIAICYRIVDAGTQTSKLYGDHRKLIITWELPHERIEYDGKDMPMSISNFYNLTFGPKSNLRKALISWRGRDFTAEELEGFELKNVLGKPCQLAVNHNEKHRAYVDAIVGLPKGMSPGAYVNPLVEYSIDDGQNEVFKALPEWLQKMCLECLEWNKGTSGARSEESNEIPPEEPGDESVPF